MDTSYSKAEAKAIIQRGIDNLQFQLDQLERTGVALIPGTEEQCRAGWLNSIRLKQRTIARIDKLPDGARLS